MTFTSQEIVLHDVGNWKHSGQLFFSAAMHKLHTLKQKIIFRLSVDLVYFAVIHSPKSKRSTVDSHPLLRR